MGGKNKISNIEIRGREFFRIKSILKRYFNVIDIKKILYVIKGKNVYEIVLSNGESVRLDIVEGITQRVINYHKNKTFYHKIAFDSGIKVPELLGSYETPDSFYKYSKWIKGKRAGFVWNLPQIFKYAGEEIAKINLIKDLKTGYFLGYNDFSKPNAIWTKQEELFLIDIEIQPKRNVDDSVIKMLLKNIKDRDRIKWFLRGYKEYRDTKIIEQELERRNYKW